MIVEPSKRRCAASPRNQAPVLVLLAASLLPAAALAQNVAATATQDVASSSPGPAVEGGLEEVIVTAQKRSENLQDIPVSESVVTADQLATAGVHNFQDLSGISASLGVTAGGNGQNSSVVMRGVGAYSFSYLTEPDVAVIIDDVPVASQSQAFSNLSDISQVEILRGPQTTLFGKSASAGVVNITTATPTHELSGKVEAALTDDGQQTYDGTVSGPITDTLSYRLTGALDDFRGNAKNIYYGDWTNGQNTGTVRAKLRWTPSSQLTVDVTGSYMNSDGSLGLIPAPVSLPATASFSGVGSVATAFAGIGINGSNSSIVNDTPPILEYDVKSGSVKIAYGTGPVTLMSITGYSDYRTYNLTDFDWTALNILGLFTADAQNGGISQEFSETTKQLSQELRAVSGPGAFRYVAGLWYADKMDDYTTVRGPYFPGLGTHLFASYWYHDSSQQYAAYGQSEWDFAPKLTLVTGLRGQEERIAYDLDNFYKGYLLNGSHQHGVITGKVSIEFHPVEDINLFASYTRGYKGETYDLTSSFTPALAAAGPVKPETSNSYELGAKTQFFERHLTLNLTAFDAEYTNFQAQTIVPTIGTGFILANVGSLRTRGLELDSRAVLNSSFSVNLGAAYTRATILSYPDGQCYYKQTAAEGCSTGPTGSFWNLGGQTLSNAPTWKLHVDANYVHNLPGTSLDGFLTASARYQSAVNFSLSPDPMTEQGAYAIVNLDLGVQPESGNRYRVALFVNNLFDRHYYNGLIDYTAYSAANTFGYVPRDFRRYSGLRVSYGF
jgi:iron complex outermembrane receptor protein